MPCFGKRGGRFVQRESHEKNRRRGDAGPCLMWPESCLPHRGMKQLRPKRLSTASGVTRGTLYHYFLDKVALFAAVHLEQRTALARAISERIQVAEGAPRQEVLLTVCQALIDETVDSRVQRILFMDGPAVLGQQILRESRPALLLLREVFEALMAEGVIDRLPLDPLIYLVWAMCFEAGVYVAPCRG